MRCAQPPPCALLQVAPGLALHPAPLPGAPILPVSVASVQHARHSTHATAATVRSVRAGGDVYIPRPGARSRGTMRGPAGCRTRHAKRRQRRRCRELYALIDADRLNAIADEELARTQGTAQPQPPQAASRSAGPADLLGRLSCADPAAARLQAGRRKGGGGAQQIAGQQPFGALACRSPPPAQRAVGSPLGFPAWPCLVGAENPRDDAPRLRTLFAALQLDSRQFAAGMFEAELTGEAFPSSLYAFARAFQNIDTEGRGCAHCPLPPPPHPPGPPAHPPAHRPAPHRAYECAPPKPV